jgi:hypothetical protein
MIDRLSAITLWASGTADHRPNIPQRKQRKKCDGLSHSRDRCRHKRHEQAASGSEAAQDRAATPEMH